MGDAFLIQSYSEFDLFYESDDYDRAMTSHRIIYEELVIFFGNTFFKQQKEMIEALLSKTIIAR